MNNISDVKKGFSDGIKGDFAPFVGKTFDVDSEELFVAAVAQGYADAKRTFSGISKFWDENKRKDFFADVAKALQTACKSHPADFDVWHEATCDDICKWFKEAGYEKGVTYGQAQKIVNMAFKYLYCLEGAEQYAIFRQCHMPLDSFTLAWYKRYVMIGKDKEYKITEEDKWSNLKKDKYQKIVVAIQKYLRDEPNFPFRGTKVTLSQHPLDAEFYVWPEMQMHLAAEEFYFAFNEEKEKADWKKKSVSDKLGDIQACIKRYQNATQ